MLTIRQFEPTDMFSVIKLASLTLTERYSPSLFNYFYETYPEGMIVAEKAHKIIGFIIGVKATPKSARILMLSVNKDFRKQKIGSQLLDSFIKIANKQKVKVIELEVRIDNINAILFYEKHGFNKIKKLKKFYQNGKSAYNMKKEL